MPRNESESPSCTAHPRRSKGEHTSCLLGVVENPGCVSVHVGVGVVAFLAAVTVAGVFLRVLYVRVCIVGYKAAAALEMELEEQAAHRRNT